MPTRVIIRAPEEDIPPSPLSRSPSQRRSRIKLSLSSKDISASPRLSGYLFIFISYVVLFVSSITNENDEKKYYDHDENNEEANNLPPIQEWKRISAVAGSASFAGFMVFTVVAHFDKMCVPSLWLAIYKDGSFGEGIILMLLFFAAIFMVYISTSINGIGGVVGKNYNVYFSSWLGFFSCVYTFGLWRDSAISTSKRSTQELFKGLSWSSQRRTTYAWSWALFFSIVTFSSILDIFLTENSFQYSQKPVSEDAMKLMLILSSTSVFCCLIGFLMNIIISNCSGCNLVQLWIKVECLLLIMLIAFWTWAVLNFTGVKGLVNGPSNSYFGIWGSFFCSISIFGSWYGNLGDSL